MARQTSFRFTVAATPAVEAVFARHAGAARFAYNQCLREVKDTLSARRRDRSAEVPWSGFSLVNYINAWKRSPAAGRTWAVDPTGQAELVGTGLAWRDQVCAQVFEEAAVDLGRALAAYTDSKAGRRRGRRVGFPRFKRKGHGKDSFRLRNKLSKNGAPSIRVGVADDPRVVVLPRIGPVRVREDTRRLRRLLRPAPNGVARARIWFATISRRRDRWILTLNVLAPDLRPGQRHPSSDGGRFVGMDLGLTAHVVAATADGHELARVAPPRPLVRALPKLRRASRAVSRKQPGSANRAKAVRRLGRVHGRVADQRRWFTHQVSTRLVKTHARLCVEDLAVANLARNRRLARSMADAAWGQLGRQLAYKASWYGTTLAVAPRFFPSSKTCSQCGRLNQALTLGDRVFRCRTDGGGCGLVIDRDRNAAANLAAWAEAHHHDRGGGDARVPDPQAAGRVNNACGGDSAGHRTRGGGETAPQPHPFTGLGRSRNRTRPPAGGQARTPEKGAGQ
jgi:putative transposase